MTLSHNPVFYEFSKLKRLYKPYTPCFASQFLIMKQPDIFYGSLTAFARPKFRLRRNFVKKRGDKLIKVDRQEKENIKLGLK